MYSVNVGGFLWQILPKVTFVEHDFVMYENVSLALVQPLAIKKKRKTHNCQRFYFILVGCFHSKFNKNELKAKSFFFLLALMFISLLSFVFCFLSCIFFNFLMSPSLTFVTFASFFLLRLFLIKVKLQSNIFMPSQSFLQILF